jgi:hypothetical protein
VAGRKEEDSQEPALTARELKWPIRAAVALVGAACLGAGGAATFITHQEGPPLGLLAVGLIFCLMGASGVMPSRLRYKDAELEFAGKMATVLLETVDDASAEDKQGVLDVAHKVSQFAPSIAAPALGAYDFEQRILGKLRIAAAGIPGAAIDDDTPTGGSQSDAVVAIPATDSSGPRRVLVEIRVDDVVTHGILDRLYADALKYARVSPVAVALLVIAKTAVSVSARQLAWHYPGMYLARADGAGGRPVDHAFRDAVSGSPIRDPNDNRERTLRA